MADNILEFFGLEGDPKEHPADTGILSFLGLKPVKEEHPAYADPYNLGRPEDRGSTTPARSGLQKVHEAIDPSTIIPTVAANVGRNVRDNALAGASMAGRGVSEIAEGKSATGAGNLALGAASVPLSLVTGPIKSGENALAGLTGNSDFADKAALMLPLNVGGPALRTAAHNIHPTTKAADFIAEKVGPDAMPEVLARLRSNPRLRPIDVNDQLRMSGQGLINSAETPVASRTMTENMRASAAGARDAVKGTYNEAMGAPPDAFEELTRLQNRAKAVGQAKIAPPLIASKPVDTSAVISDFDKVIKPGAQGVVAGEPKFPSKLQQELQEWRGELTDGSSLLTDADKLHTVQSDMRRRAEELSANPETRRLGRQLYEYRAKLVDAIEKSAPGYKEGLQGYRDQKDIERAFQLGQELLVNSKDPKTAPGYFKQWIADKDRTPEEIAAAKTGARQAIEQKMGSIKQSALDPARSGTDVPQIEFNRQKLEHLFGKEDTDKMFRHLQDERDIALTNHRGLNNSKTDETAAARAELKPRDIAQPHSNLPFWAAGMGTIAGGLTSSPTVGGLVGTGLMGIRGAKSGYDWLARRGEILRNNSLADILTRNDPETLAMLSTAAQRIRQRNKFGHLLAPP